MPFIPDADDSIPARSRGSVAGRAFTLIELLVVAAIVAVLLAIILPGLTLLRQRQRATNTRVQMEQIASAIDLYLSEHPVLGGTDAAGLSTFPGMPLRTLSAMPWVGAMLVDASGAGSGPFTPTANRRDATHPADAWGLPILFQVVNGPIVNRPPPSPPSTGSLPVQRAPINATVIGPAMVAVAQAGHFQTIRVAIRSTFGTSRIDDDLILLHEQTSSSWQPRRLLAVESDDTWRFGQ